MKQLSGSKSGVLVRDSLIARPQNLGLTVSRGHHYAQILRPHKNGRLRSRRGDWLRLIEEFDFPNLVVNTGITYEAGVAYAAVTQISPWYLMPTDGTPTVAAADTYASHAGWVEITAYDEATREVYTEVAGAAGVLTNAASPAEFTINATTTIGGIALVGGGSAPDTKGNTAGGGTLSSAAAFTGGDRALIDNDILRITYVKTMAAA